jgi:two-component system, OmpR family, sensor histidine kinase PhoQ
MDNAWKYGRSRVRVQRCTWRPWAGSSLRRTTMAGPGSGARPEALSRGARLDETQPGQGIGLAVVNELVAGLRRRNQRERSGLGGAAVKVTLPAA